MAKVAKKQVALKGVVKRGVKDAKQNLLAVQHALSWLRTRAIELRLVGLPRAARELDVLSKRKAKVK